MADSAHFVLRTVGPVDAPALARFQTECWNDVYAGIVPQSYLDATTVEIRSDRWRSRLETGNLAVTVAEVAEVDEVAEVAEAVIVGASSSTRRVGCLELKTLYVARTHWGAGVAPALLLAAVGTSAAQLWVFEANRRAVRFYIKHGFQADGGRVIDPGTGLPEIRMSRGRIGPDARA